MRKIKDDFRKYVMNFYIPKVVVGTKKQPKKQTKQKNWLLTVSQKIFYCFFLASHIMKNIL